MFKRACILFPFLDRVFILLALGGYVLFTYTLYTQCSWNLYTCIINPNSPQKNNIPVFMERRKEIRKEREKERKNYFSPCSSIEIALFTASMNSALPQILLIPSWLVAADPKWSPFSFLISLVQHSECTKCPWIVHFKIVTFMLYEIHLNLKKTKQNILFILLGFWNDGGVELKSRVVCLTKPPRCPMNI